MSDNKTIKDKMIEEFGDECMIEKAGIRYMPEILDENRKGRREIDNRLEYHHIIPVSKGGKTTIANGAIISGENHRWLHQQSPEKQAEINELLIEYKFVVERNKAMEKVKKCDKILAEMRKARKNKSMNGMER